MFPKQLYDNPTLDHKHNRIYRICNIMLIVAIFVVVVIALFLLIIGAFIPFWICIVEIIVFVTLLMLHVKGHYYTSRYIFFVFAILMQMVGSLYHGEYGGFDFLFFATALTPVLFFDKKRHVVSLFILSITAFIAVKILYNYVEPAVYLDRQIFPYYSIIIISALIIYFSFALFKSDHLKYEQHLLEQKELIHAQKEAISDAKNQLEDLLQVRTKVIKKQNRNMIQYAYLNSHKARSPLARILGLINLIKLEDMKIEEKREYYIKALVTNANDLDSVLKEISAILNKNLEH